MTLAPIALFVYKRPIHTKRMIESLLKNPEYLDSSINVFCDGPACDQETSEVIATRQIVNKMLPGANIVERKQNIGLAESIITGVSNLCSKYGRVIVFEDDLILSPTVLRYFNEALNYYEKYERVMHISGYMYPVEQELPPTFFYREATPWGWATWGRSWRYFESNSKKIIVHLKKNRLKKEFNIKNSMFFWKMLQAQSLGKIDSWAIRWYGSMFMKKGLALYPGRSLMQNNGFDGSGIHCKSTDEYEVELSEVIPSFSNEIIESQSAVQAMVTYRHKYKRGSIGKRINNFIENIL